MSQSLAQIYLHLIFSTKDRKPTLIPEVRDPLRGYFHGILRDLKCPNIAANCVADHAHLLFRLDKGTAPTLVVRELKRSSSQWLKKQDPRLAKFQWQAGYGMFSVSASRVPAVIEYVKNQEIRHRKLSFQDELRKLFREADVDYDERHVWD